MVMRALLWFLSSQQKGQIHALTADREFIGRQWLTCLISHNIDFVIRIRKDALARQADRTTQAYKLFATHQLRVLRKRREVFGLSLYMRGQQLYYSDYLISITTLAGKQGISLYQQRWKGPPRG